MKKTNHQPRYVITTGWWCGPDSEVNVKRTKFGSESIRSLNFFDQWHAAVDKYTDPVKILIVDSASEHIPTPHPDPRVELISLDENAGHSTSHIGKYSVGPDLFSLTPRPNEGQSC